MTNLANSADVVITKSDVPFSYRPLMAYLNLSATPLTIIGVLQMPLFNAIRPVHGFVLHELPLALLAGCFVGFLYSWLSLLFIITRLRGRKIADGKITFLPTTHGIKLGLLLITNVVTLLSGIYANALMMHLAGFNAENAQFSWLIFILTGNTICWLRILKWYKGLPD